MKHSIVTLICAVLPGFVFLLPASDKARETEESPSLITIQKGDLPIILSAPHGGQSKIPGVEPRKGEGIVRFVQRSDQWTDRLTEKLAEEIEIKTGKRPYIVVAKFHRKFIDVNRPPQLAYESAEAKPTYDAYHEAMASARREVIARWGSGIILDIHGQAAELDTVIRGTQNGKTTTHLIEKFGRKSLTGNTSLFGGFAKEGLQIFPTIDSQKKEHPKYNGGYIVSTYGSQKEGAIDAIQLELGRNLRHPAAVVETAKKLATAVAGFSDTYLPKSEKSEKNSPASRTK